MKRLSFSGVKRFKGEYIMEGQTVTTVFPKTNEEKLVEFQGLLYELEDVLRKLDELQRREVAEKEAALAETVNMQKLSDYRIGDAYEQRAKDIERTRYNNVALSLSWE
jgi:hypothetical protein